MSVPINTYYKFESCCTDEILYFQGPLLATSPFWNFVLPQVLVYDLQSNRGDYFGLISGDCYLTTPIIAARFLA